MASIITGKMFKGNK